MFHDALVPFAERRKIDMNIVIFGAGLFYQNRKRCLEKQKILAILDNDRNKQGSFLDGIEIQSVSAIKELEYDIIILMGKEDSLMREQLFSLGVDTRYVCSFNEWEEYIASVSEKYLGLFHDIAGKRIVLVTHELSNSGAPIVLGEFAKILKKRGYGPIMLSPCNGPLKESIENAGIPVLIEEDLSRENRELWGWLADIGTIIVNTLILKEFVMELGGRRNKVIWWLHEGEDIYDDVEHLTGGFKKVGKNVQVVSAGPVATNSYIRHFHDKHIQPLFYGLPDLKQSNKPNKLVFALIGAIQPRKAQDIFIDAVKILPPYIKSCSEFWIIGKELNQEYAQDVKKSSIAVPEIKFLGEIDSQEMDKVYENINVIVCPSRIDTMPVVVAEGFKHAIPCIISENVGQSSLIQNEKEGLICQKEDYEDLSMKMAWFFFHPEKHFQMGNAARRFYEQNFSMEQFEKNIIRLIEEG